MCDSKITVWKVVEESCRGPNKIYPLDSQKESQDISSCSIVYTVGKNTDKVYLRIELHKPKRFKF